MQEENLDFYKTIESEASLIFEQVELKKVKCIIQVPAQHYKNIIIKAELNQNGLSAIQLKSTFDRRKFSLKSETFDEYGKLSCLISSNSCFILKRSQKDDYIVLEVKLFNLKIQEFYQVSNNGNKKKTFSYWLTQSYLLSPNILLEEYRNNNVAIKNSSNISFVLAKKTRFDFLNTFTDYSRSGRKDIKVLRSTLVAKFNGITDCQLDEGFFQNIDLFLELVSFSERRKIVCFGYEGYSAGKKETFFRRDIVIPEDDIENISIQPLIDRHNFKEFITTSWKKLDKCRFKSYLVDALRKASYPNYSNGESACLSYYSALENLVNGYKSMKKIDCILDEPQWKKFSQELKDYIKENSYLSSNKYKGKRELIYQKLRELNRASFNTVFDKFCNFYNVDIEDLCPLKDLSDTRNRLVHGEIFRREEYELIICSKDHLKWMLERCILSVLGWDIQRSTVRARDLKGYSSYDNWRDIIPSSRRNLE